MGILQSLEPDYQLSKGLVLFAVVDVLIVAVLSTKIDYRDLTEHEGDLYPMAAV